MKQAIRHLKKVDPKLAAVIDQVGPYSVQYGEATFHNLARSIIYQQLSGKVAAVIFSRLVAKAGDPLTPEGILRLRVPTLRKAGLSAAKADYVRNLARHTRSREVVFEELPDLDDAGVIDRLTAVKGIGPWTAQMFLMFALRRPDVFPTADLGIRMAMKAVYDLSELPKPAEMEAIGNAWKPWRSVATWYLWRSLELPKATDA